jgi:hypothetical protein
MAVHEQVLDAALALAERRNWTFHVADVIAALPALNAGTVRTHVASRCCVNAPAHHQSRHAYFRAIGRGLYRIEPAARQRRRRRRRPWQDRILATLDSGVDPTLIAESLRWTPTERLERMRRAAASLQDARG